MALLRKTCIAASLVLCLASTALWIGCNWNLFALYFRSGNIQKNPRVRTDYGIVARPGALQCERQVISPADFLRPDSQRWAFGRLAPPQRGQLAFVPWRESPYESGTETNRPDTAFLGAGYGRVLYVLPLMEPFGPQILESRCDFIVIPFWLLTLLFAIPPALALIAKQRRSRRRHRAPATLCVRCGYDIRASVNRCPECGTPIQTTGREGVTSPLRAPTDAGPTGPGGK